MRYPVGILGNETEFKKYWYLAQRFNSPPGHDGVDINLQTGGNTDLGEPLYAIADGSIRYIHNHHPDKLFGLHFALEIQGPWGTRWAHYAHCDPRDFPQEPQVVREGQMIARLGKTGTQLAHLHFSILKVEPDTIGGIDTVSYAYKTLMPYWEDPVKFIQQWMQPVSPEVTIVSEAEVLRDEVATLQAELGRLRSLILNWYTEWGQNGMHDAFHALMKEAKEMERRP